MSLLHIAGGVTEDKLDASDVFSTYLYTGNGSTQTINNGIDLAGKGGLVWGKNRTSVVQHALFDTVRGQAQRLATNLTSGQVEMNTPDGVIKSFNSNGFTLNTTSGTVLNDNGQDYVSWTFRKAPKFFDLQTKVHITGTPSTIDLSTLGVVGMVTVKSTVGTLNWFTWHRSLTVGNNLKLNLTDAQSVTNAYLSVSGTTLTISGSAPSDTYIIYAWAHDPSADGIIQCGSFTTDASGNATVNLGWEPQYILLKRSDSSGIWWVLDSMRGVVSGAGDAPLQAQSANAEGIGGTNYVDFNASGFQTFSGLHGASSGTYIYLAIRRPNKVPTSGSEVFKAVVTNNPSTPFHVTTGFTVDMFLSGFRNLATSKDFVTRLTGGTNYLVPNSTAVEAVAGSDMAGFADNNGYTNGINYSSSYTNIDYAFKRAKGFMDIVCYTGTGAARTVNHNLGVVPELIIVKSRSLDLSWIVWYGGVNNWNVLNGNYATQTTSNLWNNQTPNSTVFSLGTDGNVNSLSTTFVAYLFATLAGVSKVGSYTGNGSSQTIPCGFSTGARFILVKRTDSTGDWYLWDTARGIVAANDPHLSLNTTAAEVTTDDSIDPESSGFIVNQNTATNINVNGAGYIFLAIA